MHASFAAWLERRGRGRDDLASLLAHHYVQAVKPEDVDLVWAGEQAELERLRAKALVWLERAADFATRRYEIEDALELLHKALALSPEEEAQARLWRAVGRANALKFDGDAFRTAMENSLVVCTDKATCGDTYSELAFQTAIRSSMWTQRPDRKLVHGWIDQALDLSDKQSVARAKALIAKSFWERNSPEAAREASDIAERSIDIDLRSYAWAARAVVAFGEGDFESAVSWSQRRLESLHEISDPDHVADIYETAIPAVCANGNFAEARRLAIEHHAVVEPLSNHHRLHGVAMLLEVEELAGGWERILELSELTHAAVEANLATPCARNARSLLLTALAAAYRGDADSAQRYERRANEVATEGYDFVLSAPRTWLALLRGQIDEVDRIEGVDLARVPNAYALAAAAARLDALASLREGSLVEREAPPLMRGGSYLEPFALRALGAVREDESLLDQAVARFDEMGLPWHADQTRKAAH